MSLRLRRTEAPWVAVAGSDVAGAIGWHVGAPLNSLI